MINLSKIKKILTQSKTFLWLYKKYRARTRKVYLRNYHLFERKQGIEIGGPSAVFNKTGPFPIYKIIESLDNINFSDNNFWSNIKEGNNYFFQEGKKNGKQIIADAIDLSVIKDETYEFMLSSHVIEHVANPIKALYEWRRIIKKNGYLIIIAPDRRFTYDRNRPLTQLAHLIDDFKQNTLENDQTHIQEVIELHDLSNDGTVDTHEAHVERSLNNEVTRIVHHHTFDIDLLMGTLKEAHFDIIDWEVFRPYHLLVIAKRKD
ncbi:MAG: methyltransferase domain-containing protein [Bacteroidota bacterium]